MATESANHIRLCSFLDFLYYMVLQCISFNYSFVNSFIFTNTHCLTGTRETPDSLAKFLGCLVGVILAIPSHLLNFVHLLGGNERVKFHFPPVEGGDYPWGIIPWGIIPWGIPRGIPWGSRGAPNNTRQTQGQPRLRYVTHMNINLKDCYCTKKTQIALK